MLLIQGNKERSTQRPKKNVANETMNLELPHSHYSSIKKSISRTYCTPFQGSEQFMIIVHFRQFGKQEKKHTSNRSFGISSFQPHNLHLSSHSNMDTDLNNLRLREDIYVSTSVLEDILTAIGRDPLELASELLQMCVHDTLKDILQSGVAQTVQATVNRISKSVSESEKAHPRFSRSYKGLSLADMVLLGNRIVLQREWEAEIDGSVYYIPSISQSRWPGGESPMHDLVIAIWGERPWTDEVFRKRIRAFEGEECLSTMFRQKLGVEISPEVRDRYVSLEGLADLVRISYFQYLKIARDGRL
jgi:hypothetical protein